MDSQKRLDKPDPWPVALQYADTSRMLRISQQKWGGGFRAVFCWGRITGHRVS
jgi:hypothetical protein